METASPQSACCDRGPVATALIPDNARLFVEGMEEVYGFETVTAPAAADAILVRLDAPFEKGRASIIGEYFHGGTLAFPQETLVRMASYSAQAPLFIAYSWNVPRSSDPWLTWARRSSVNSGQATRSFWTRSVVVRRLRDDCPSTFPPPWKL